MIFGEPRAVFPIAALVPRLHAYKLWTVSKTEICLSGKFSSFVKKIDSDILILRSAWENLANGTLLSEIPLETHLDLGRNRSQTHRNK